MKRLKTNKVNIGLEKEPKFAKIGNYWDEETSNKFTKLLHEYQDLFPTRFLEMRGIIEDLAIMKIPLKLDVKPIKQRPYRLKLKFIGESESRS